MMTTNEMKTVLYIKLQEENAYFTKSDISIKKHGIKKHGNEYTIEYRIVIKDYEHIPFKMFLEYNKDFGYAVFIYTVNIWDAYNVALDENVAFIENEKDFDIKTALIDLGYYIGTRF